MRHEKPQRPGYATIRQMKRGSYDRELAHQILDKGLVGHVGFVDDGHPMVIPMAYARVGDQIYIHGASTTRAIKDVDKGAPVTLTVTHLDGIVVARAAMHMSMNYRCAIVHGTAYPVDDENEKTDALAAITDHLLPGRWDECREMLPKEFKATGVLRIDVEHVATKVRGGPPVDDDDDLGLPIWGGELPITTTFGAPLSDQYVTAGASTPPSLDKARRKFT